MTQLETPEHTERPTFLPPTLCWWSVSFHTVSIPYWNARITDIVVEAPRPKDALLAAVGKFIPSDNDLIVGVEMSQPFTSKIEAEEWLPPA